MRVTGGDTREIRVDIDLDKAKAAGIAPGQIAERIGMENLNLPAGRLQLGPNELTVRTLGQFKNVDELARAARREAASRARRCGSTKSPTVTDGVADRRTHRAPQRQGAVIIEVVKRPGSNTVDVARRA